MLLTGVIAPGYSEALQFVYTVVEVILGIIFTLRDFHVALTC